MQWFVLYGRGWVLRPVGKHQPLGQGWILQSFDSEEAAVAFAQAQVKSGLNVVVGEESANVEPKYETADIARMMK